MEAVQEGLKSLVGIFFKLFFLVSPKRKKSSELQETIDLYKGDGFAELFAEIRTWDAPYEPIDKLIKKNAVVLDLGCGDGTLSNYLAISSPRRKIFGIDINKNRVQKAYRGLKNTKFQQGDILKMKIVKPDVVILAHVLHHLPTKNEQLLLLEKISKSFGKNKELIILEIDNRPFIKYIFTWLTDAITVPIIFEKKLYDMNFFYRRSEEWKSILEGLNFKVKTKKVDRGMPFSHVLIYAKKMA